jgi:hypothetical protein
MTVDGRAAVGDYDGDGKHDLAYVDAALGRWYVVPTRGFTSTNEVA